MSINKIHVNSSTNMTLNDRFTVMQSTGPKVTNSLARKLTRRRSQNSLRADVGAPSNVSLANRKFVQKLERKHKIQTALKLKRRSLKVNMPARQRIRTRIGLKKGAAKAIRVTPSGKVIRSNSLTNIATMNADLVGSALKRSNSASNLASRLGTRRRGGNGGGPLPRRQLKRSVSKQRLATARSRSRSRSVPNIRRANSKMNLRRTNSRGNLKTNNGREVPPQKRINRNRTRSVSRQRKRSASVSGRVGRPNTNLTRRRLSQNGIGNGNLNSQGRPPFRRRNSTGNVNKSGVRQGRVSRPRGRGGAIQQRGRSRSRSRVRNNSVQGNRRNVRGSARGNQQRGRGRRGRSQVRGAARVQKPEIKKEDLDKELDQYMAHTKTSLDKDLDVYMSGNAI